MTASPDSPRKGLRTVVTVVALTAVAVLAYKAFVPYELALNTTPSIPRGLYLAKSVDSAPLTRGAGACFAYVPPAWAAERAYFEPGRRLCKYVAALPGDRISVAGQVLEVRAANGDHLQTAPLATQDSRGKPLPADALATGVVPSGKILMLAPANANSLDSRYLGLVDQAAISHQIWPLWVQH